MRKQLSLAAVAAVLVWAPSCVDSFATRNNPYINDLSPRYGHGGRYSPSAQGYEIGPVPSNQRGGYQPPGGQNPPPNPGGYQGPGAVAENNNRGPEPGPGTSGRNTPDGGTVTEVPAPDKPPTTPDPPVVPDPPTPGGSELGSDVRMGPGGYPYGIPVPGKKGFVISPYARDQGQVDVRDFSSGTKVTDPYSGKVILVP